MTVGPTCQTRLAQGRLSEQPHPAPLEHHDRHLYLLRHHRHAGDHLDHQFVRRAQDLQLLVPYLASVSRHHQLLYI